MNKARVVVPLLALEPDGGLGNDAGHLEFTSMAPVGIDFLTFVQMLTDQLSHPILFNLRLNLNKVGQAVL